MKNKSSNHILRVAIIAALIINLFIAAKSGWYIGLHTVYAIWGQPAEAVVQEVSRYFATVREPKPTRYSPRFRGQYVFDVRIDSVEPVRITGRFDTSDLIGSSKNEIFTGDRLSIKYLSFYPYWSRPVMAFELFKLIIAGCFFAASSFLSATFLFILLKLPFFLKPN